VFKMFQTKDEDEDIVTEEYKFPQLDHTIILRGASEITNSTGLGLWRGAEVLASFLASHPDMVRDKCVLELGAGQGLCGLVAHHVGASKVLLTDGDTAVLKNLRYNVNLNTTTKESGRNNDKCSSSSSSSSSNNNNMVSCPQFIWGRNTSDFLKTYNDGKKFHVF
jgi:Predicted methyltransferase